jgi:hypothetical protein
LINRPNLIADVSQWRLLTSFSLPCWIAHRTLYRLSPLVWYSPRGFVNRLVDAKMNLYVTENRFTPVHDDAPVLGFTVTTQFPPQEEITTHNVPAKFINRLEDNRPDSRGGATRKPGAKLYLTPSSNKGLQKCAK